MSQTSDPSPRDPASSASYGWDYMGAESVTLAPDCVAVTLLAELSPQPQEDTFNLNSSDRVLCCSYFAVFRGDGMFTGAQNQGFISQT